MGSVTRAGDHDHEAVTLRLVNRRSVPVVIRPDDGSPPLVLQPGASAIADDSSAFYDGTARAFIFVDPGARSPSGVPVRTCPYCGWAFRLLGRQDRRYCSDRCQNWAAYARKKARKQSASKSKQQESQ